MSKAGKVFIGLLVVIGVIVGGTYYSNYKDDEKRYQEGISLIQQSKWDKASQKFVMLFPGPGLDRSTFKFSKELYAYATARDAYQKECYQLANNLLSDLDFNYHGPYEKDIWFFQKEVKAKAAALTPEQIKHEQEVLDKEAKDTIASAQKSLDEYKSNK